MGITLQQITDKEQMCKQFLDARLTFTLWNVAVVEPLVWVCGVAPGPLLVVVGVPAVVLLQPLPGVLLGRKAVEGGKESLTIQWTPEQHG